MKRKIWKTSKPNIRGLFDKSREDLDKFATQLYWKAQNLIEEANSLESKADVIRTYLGATEREEVL